MTNEPRTVTREQIEAEIASEHCFTAAEGQAGAVGRPRADVTHIPAALDLLTICVLLLKNGHKVVGINYGAIDPAAHSAELGREDARQDARNKVRDYLGFRLRDQIAAEACSHRNTTAIEPVNMPGGWIAYCKCNGCGQIGAPADDGKACQWAERKRYTAADITDLKWATACGIRDNPFGDKVNVRATMSDGKEFQSAFVPAQGEVLTRAAGRHILAVANGEAP